MVKVKSVEEINKELEHVAVSIDTGDPSGKIMDYPKPIVKKVVEKQFSDGEINDLIDAVSTSLSAYKNKNHPKSVRQKVRWRHLFAKLGGLTK